MGHLNEDSGDPEPVPDLIEHEGAPEKARVDSVEIALRQRADRLGGFE